METGVIRGRVQTGDGGHLQLADGTMIVSSLGLCLPDFPVGTAVIVWYRVVHDQLVAEAIRVQADPLGRRPA